jgi:hypothetical protein
MRQKQGWWHPIAIFAGLAVLVAIGTAVYVALNRLSTEALTIMSTVGCAAALAAPGTLLTITMLIRRAENGRARPEPAAPQATQPVMMVVPPMALQPQQLPQPQQQPAWNQAPTRREYTVVGDEGDW